MKWKILLAIGAVASLALVAVVATIIVGMRSDRSGAALPAATLTAPTLLTRGGEYTFAYLLPPLVLRVSDTKVLEVSDTSNPGRFNMLGSVCSTFHRWALYVDEAGNIWCYCGDIGLVGLVVRPNDGVYFAQTSIQWIDNPQILRGLGVAVPTAVDQFVPEQVRAKYR